MILCAFKKGHSSQHALIRVVEMICRCIDKAGGGGGITTMILMDRSKGYDCLLHDLLIAKLNADGVGIDRLKLMYSYLTDGKQRVKVCTSFNT